MKLTPLQQRFIAEYRVDGHAARAAHRAGYPAAMAAHWGRKALCNRAIQKALQEDAAPEAPQAHHTPPQAGDALKAATPQENAPPKATQQDLPSSELAHTPAPQVPPHASALPEPPYALTARQVLWDIHTVGREAREQGDLKTALRALELALKYMAAHALDGTHEEDGEGVDNTDGIGRVQIFRIPDNERD